jgi:hypothetical protein
VRPFRHGSDRVAVPKRRARCRLYKETFPVWLIICGIIIIAVLTASLYPEQAPARGERREPTLDPASWSSIDTGPAGPALSTQLPRDGAN